MEEHYDQVKVGGQHIILELSCTGLLCKANKQDHCTGSIDLECMKTSLVDITVVVAGGLFGRCTCWKM